MHKDLITAEEARQLFSYNPDTGDLTRRSRKQNVFVEGVVGTPNNYGHLVVGAMGKTYLAHRIAWLIVTGEWPAIGIDHVNGCSRDNRWCNLRLATKSQNAMNRGVQSNNASGLKGVSWHKASKKWQAHISVNGRGKYLGLYEKASEAHAAYCTAAKELHGDFANTG